MWKWWSAFSKNKTDGKYVAVLEKALRDTAFKSGCEVNLSCLVDEANRSFYVKNQWLGVQRNLLSGSLPHFTSVFDRYSLPKKRHFVRNLLTSTFSTGRFFVAIDGCKHVSILFLRRQQTNSCSSGLMASMLTMFTN